MDRHHQQIQQVFLVLLLLLFRSGESSHPYFGALTTDEISRLKAQPAKVDSLSSGFDGIQIKQSKMEENHSDMMENKNNRLDKICDKLDKQFDDIAKKFDDMKHDSAKKFDDTAKKFDDMKQDTTKKFDDMKIDIKDRFDKVDLLLFKQGNKILHLAFAVAA